MAYQKLQTSRAASVIPSDTLNIPSVSSENGRGNNGCVLYVGTGGDLNVLTAGGDTVILKGVPTGSFIPIQVVRVYNLAPTFLLCFSVLYPLLITIGLPNLALTSSSISMIVSLIKLPLPGLSGESNSDVVKYFICFPYSLRIFFARCILLTLLIVLILKRLLFY